MNNLTQLMALRATVRLVVFGWIIAWLTGCSLNRPRSGAQDAQPVSSAATTVPYSPTAPSSSADAVQKSFGFGRHNQLLGPNPLRLLSLGVTISAITESNPNGIRGGLLRLYDLGSRSTLAEAQVSPEALPVESSSSTPMWHFFPAGVGLLEGHYLWCSAKGGVFIQAIPRGEPREASPRGDTLLAVSSPSSPTNNQIAVRGDGRLMLLRFDARASDASIRVIDTEVVQPLGATFIKGGRGACDRVGQEELVVLCAGGGRSGAVMDVLFLDANGCEMRRLRVCSDVQGDSDCLSLLADSQARAPGKSLRVAAMRSTYGDVIVGIGWPEAQEGRGTGAILRVCKSGTLEVVTSRAELVCLYPSDEEDGLIGNCRFGQAVEVVDDWDGDGVPDVAFTWPYGLTRGVGVLSGADACVVGLWRDDAFQMVGCSLCWDLDSNRMVLGGAGLSVPENEAAAGAAVVLQRNTMPRGSLWLQERLWLP